MLFDTAEEQVQAKKTLARVTKQIENLDSKVDPNDLHKAFYNVKQSLTTNYKRTLRGYCNTTKTCQPAYRRNACPDENKR